MEENELKLMDVRTCFARQHNCPLENTQAKKYIAVEDFFRVF